MAALMRPAPSAASTVVGVIGDPIDQSLSPLLHNAAFDELGLDWVSVGFVVREGQAADALAGMRALGIGGLSVTMPHKEAAANLVDTASALAVRLEAVNCVVWTPGGLRGENTDGAGFVASLARGAGFSARAKRCVVLGAGGAARAVIAALADEGASEVVVVNRTAERAARAAELASPVGRVGTLADVATADLVVQATPRGMTGGPPGPGPESSSASVLHQGQVAVDLVYRPAETPWLAEAAARGATTIGGIGMLVHQAAAQLQLWTGLQPPLEAMWAAASNRSRV
jgi:shikimate dehydrogenase